MTAPDVPDRVARTGRPYRLALVGGGPRATYALERLSATVGRLGPGKGLEVRLFDRTGEFGAGQALDAFADELRRRPGAELHLHRAEIVNIEASDDVLTVVTSGGGRHLADEVVLLTGRSHHAPQRTRAGRRLARTAARAGARHIPHPYPMDRELGPGHCGREAVVGCAGMGLTAIDTVLHLTEGRGGRFEAAPGGGLVYRPSGTEPAGIVAFSGSGLFPYARPDNHKASDGSGDHRGTFLTREAVRHLRVNVGSPYPGGGDGRQPQLDFEMDVLPLIVLEMAHLHYLTLFGPGITTLLTRHVMPDYLTFLCGTLASGAGRDCLLAPLETAVGQVTEVLDSVVNGTRTVAEAQLSVSWPVRDVLLHWTRVVFGPSAELSTGRCVERAEPPKLALDGLTSPSALDTAVTGNRFGWDEAVGPVRSQPCPEDFRRRTRAFMERDQRWAVQGNRLNPHKAASDGVWRDLRPVISYAVDDAGLTADSQRTFLNRYVRHHNRLANGAAPEIMAKVLALIVHGLLDVGAGPEARVRPDEPTGRVVVDGPHTGFVRPVDVLVDARTHAFDPRADALPLYRNLLASGTVRLWRNASADGEDFVPGGLDLTPDFHPVRADGSVEPRVTVLGAPSEGARSFLPSALRPDADHYVMRSTLTWLNGFREVLEA
ncbi:FAD/NAD(P)-binding protein [Streptomyces sp. NPDC050529]|uniref:FAD/NAD(P)-binding protein n=1 Tax=Streptomyces sp. NPDC050529 TaxID=3365624 RepID=UPI0037AEAF34